MALLKQAVRLLDDVPGADWNFGGGSALAFLFGHRISYDVDIFLHDAQVLAYLSPRVNDLSASLAESYDEAANGIKLTTHSGDIDFIVAGDVTTEATLLRRPAEFERDISIQAPAEILAKKVQYRGFRFTHRDIFDLAMLIERDPTSVEKALAGCARSEIEKATKAIREALPNLRSELPKYVNPTEAFLPLLDRAPDLMRAFTTRTG